MCGIAGFVGSGSEEDLKNMIGEIRYRGPDDRGLFMENGVGLGHARLSIIDLSPLGHQPMWNSAKDIAVIFNGEIYNYRELKRELTSYQFRSSSDTEVIIALYEKYGEKCFERLSGMFAIALYDLRNKRLLLARDRMGKKPLYYALYKGSFIFASEPKAIFAHPLSQKQLDPFALQHYLSLDYVPTPLSIWKGVSKLAPGSFLVFEHKKTRIESFWSPDVREKEVSLISAVSELERLLSGAVSSRLMSDVPLGVFLSGGLDSSAIAYYAGKANKEPVHTFSIGFDEKSFDESDYAKEVAAYLHTDHHHKLLSAHDSLEIIPEVFTKLDEPMADASIIPTYLLSRFTKEHVTVALGGDGGDELFAGYPTFQAERFAALYKRIPHVLQKEVIERAVAFMPTSQKNFSLKFKLEKFLEGANEQSIAARHMRWLGTFGPADLGELLQGKGKEFLRGGHEYAFAEKYLADCLADNDLNKLLWVYQRTYMMDQVMVKVDRASMYASLETRAPFLDREVVEFANRLPYDMKLRGFTTKYILKTLMRGKLPDHIIDRSKKGFGIPVGAWLRSELKDWAGELLHPKGELLGGMLSKAVVERLWEEHQSGVRDNRKKLWNLLVLLEWERNFC